MNDLPENAVVIGDWEQATVFWCYQQVEGRRPDLGIVYPSDRLGVYAGGSRPICLARSVSVGPEWHPSAVGPLACLARQTATSLPAGATPLGLALQTPDGRPALELAAYHLSAPTCYAGSYAPLTLVWRALGDRREDYYVSLHILDEQWRQVWAEDAAPVLGMYPTSRWTAGEVVQDYRELAVQPTFSRDATCGRWWSTGSWPTAASSSSAMRKEISRSWAAPSTFSNEGGGLSSGTRSTARTNLRTNTLHRQNTNVRSLTFVLVGPVTTRLSSAAR